MNGGKFDLQSSLAGPGFPWRKYDGEYHLSRNYNYLGPGTRLDIRLDNNMIPKENEEPYNNLDNVALNHDIRYTLAEQSENPLNEKHSADKLMLEELDKITTSDIPEWFAKQLTKLAINTKLKLGIGLNPKIPKEKKILAKELHRPIKHNFPRRNVIILGLDDTWSVDLIIMPVSDNSYKNILIAIDNFSKYAWGIPLKTKTTKELIQAFQTIFSTSNRKPKRIWSDHESAIYSNEFQNFCIDNNIILYSTQSELKAIIAERFIRTFKNKMWIKFTELDYHSLDYYGKSKYKDKINWIKLVQPILDEYNNTIHSTIKLTPNEASKPENSDLVHEALLTKYKKWNNKPSKFNVNDMVRIYQWKQDVGRKGYSNNYTNEVFKVKEVFDTVPYTYSLVDKNNELIQGKFYEQEMTKSVFNFDNKYK